MNSFLKMVTLDEYGFTCIVLLVFCFQSTHAYIKRCPEMVELVLYSKDKCKNHYEYHCLALHRIAFNNYKEECRIPEWVSLGNYAVLRGRYIDYETCPVSSYQPFLFRSNERSKCTYLMSMCSSDGQVEVNDGTTTSDKACRCDFKRGFAFVIRPQNQSACIPSREDCSCYSKRCVKGQNLNPDYECQTITVRHGNSTHHVVTVTDKENTSHNASFVVTNLNNFVFGKEERTYCLFGLTSLIIFVITLTCAFSLPSCIYPFEQLTNNTSLNQAVYKKQKIQTINQKTALGLVHKTEDSTKENEHQYRDRKIYEIDNKRNEETAARTYIVQTNVGFGTRAILEIDKQSNRGYKEINRVKTETESSSPTEKADIIILHIEEENQKTEVESFKSHLATLSEKMVHKKIVIKLFEDVFHKKEGDSDIEIEAVLKKCIYVFVYISKKSYPSKLRRLGLKESFIQDILEEPTSKTHVKIVCNCDDWELPAYRYLSLTMKDVDLDYFHYIKQNPDIVLAFEKTCKDYLENIRHNDKTKQYN